MAFLIHVSYTDNAWWYNFRMARRLDWGDELAKYNGRDVPQSVTEIEFDTEEDAIAFILKWS